MVASSSTSNIRLVVGIIRSSLLYTLNKHSHLEYCEWNHLGYNYIDTPQVIFRYNHLISAMSITTYWRIPPDDFLFKLAPGNVHVWRAPLGESPERASRFRPYLSESELTRADRCRVPHPQYQFVVTRGVLRTLLSRYAGVSPTEIHFENQSHGKPMLVTPSADPIQFNVSHARGMALIAISLQHAVGIDVEWIDRTVQDRDIAERYFSKRESAHLMSLPPRERTQQFFSYWTCKEAYLKMEGRGIT